MTADVTSTPQDAEQDERSWRRPATIYRLVAVAASLAVVAALLIDTSRAAFTDTTDNGPNSFGAGTVSLVDDDQGSVLFNVSNLAPDDSTTRCIAVTYQGTLTANVHLYGTVGGSGLAPYLDLDVDVGTGGGFGSCAGFSSTQGLYSGSLSGFTGHSDYGSGLTGFDGATNPTTRTYRFTVTFPDTGSPAINGAQGTNATATFTWEAQNV